MQVIFLSLNPEVGQVIPEVGQTIALSVWPVARNYAQHPSFQFVQFILFFFTSSSLLLPVRQTDCAIHVFSTCWVILLFPQSTKQILCVSTILHVCKNLAGGGGGGLNRGVQFI